MMDFAVWRLSPKNNLFMGSTLSWQNQNKIKNEAKMFTDEKQMFFVDPDWITEILDEWILKPKEIGGNPGDQSGNH